MCGIAGFNWPDEALIASMTEAIRHRGPDDEGQFVDAELSLGHRRLSILDLSALGRQPMEYERAGRRAIISFNGEIYNFRALREKLEHKGYRFRSHTDTEVILAAYLEWGSDCVAELNGMWAFAIYDPVAKTVLLSRDRFGEKPLYYRHDGGRFVFASEIKAILAHPVPRRADPVVVSEYLYRGAANGSLASFFAGIRMLPPAHNAVFDLRKKSLALREYYRPTRGRRAVSAEEFRDALRKSVESRLVADVPVSISLSSGIDSTPVAALTAQVTDSGVKAFTTASGEEVGDETALLSHFLQRYPRFELEKSHISESRFCDHYRDILYHMDEPFARQSAYVRWEIANLTALHGRKVLLNGEGADELLGGYAAFAPVFMVDLLKRLRLVRFATELAATLRHPERRKILAGLRRALGLPAGGGTAESATLRGLRGKFGIRLDPVAAGPPRGGDLKDYLFELVHDYSLPRLLVCNDKMTMANSVEGRAPFLDHELVDLVFSMDADELMVRGWRKFPLRRAMQGLVPDEILFRKSKDAFHAPIFEYLRNGGIRRRIETVFADARTAAVFSPQAYLAEYRRFLDRKGADRAFLLHGFLLEEWARIFEVDLAC